VEWVNYKSLISRSKLKKVSRIICNSKFTKQYVDKKTGKNSLVLYPPVNSGSKDSIKKENIILTVGRYQSFKKGDSFKKQEFLIDVFKKMVDESLKNWKFVIVVSFKEEDKEHIEEMKKRTTNYPIEIIENATWRTLEDLYKKTKIYWHASGFNEDLDKNPEKAEHFGITTVEAMSYGAVPVVINAGGQREIVDEGSGFLWESEKELIKNTSFLIEDEKSFLSMSKNAYEKSKMFTGERFCKELKEIINEI